jgi:hypothetical protein
MMTGGCMTAIFNLLNKLNIPLDGISGDSISTYLFAIVAAVAGIIALRSGQAISKHASVKECKLTVTICSQSITLNALADSGNLVRDPISGKQVVLIDRSALSSLTDVAVYDDYLNGKVNSASKTGVQSPRGLRLIPISTAGGKSMLAASVPDSLTVSFTDHRGKLISCTPDVLIAPSDINNSANGYKAIVPADILK